jgi:phage shock protein C
MENNNQPKRLYRSKNRMLAGVLAGFAEYINADPTIIRVAYVLLSILSAAFPGIIVYIIFWAITPEKPA